MSKKLICSATAVALAGLLAGCAADSIGGITTSALTTSATSTKVAAQAPKVDPACVTLTSQIDALRKDGVTERMEKVLTGKSSTVSVKRTSLAKMTELAKANAEFQAKCATLSPVATQQTQPAASAPVTGQLAAPIGKAADAAAAKGTATIATKAASAAAPAGSQMVKP